MKKIIGVLAAVGVALALVGCDTVTPTGGSLNLVGTWAAKASNSTTLSVTPATNGKEGTWEYTNISYPSVGTDTVNSAGVTNTDYDGNQTTTTTTTVKMVIKADGSYVRTTTQVTDVGAFTAPTATVTHTYSTTISGVTTSGVSSITASKTTKTTVETSVVTVVGAAYQEVITKVCTYTNVTGGVTTTDSRTSGSSQYITSAGSLSFNTTNNLTIAFQTTLGGSSNLISNKSLTQTAYGTTLPAIAGVNTTKTVTYSLVLGKDGSFTYTTTAVVNQAARDAVAATVNNSAAPAVTAGTQTTTTVYTGTYTSLAGTTTYANQTDQWSTLYFNTSKTTESKVGTGSLVDQNFPVTATTATDTGYALAKSWTIKVVKGSGTGAVSTMVAQTAATDFPYTGPYGSTTYPDLLFTMAAAQ